ncbi:MAG: glycoside hydrolase family 76 protein [Christensenellales bacterium]
MNKAIKTAFPILLAASLATLLLCAANAGQARHIDPMVIEVTQNFIDTYWDGENNYFYRNNTKKTDLMHFSGPMLGKYTDYWLEAQNWETVMDIYERQGGDFYRQLVDKVFEGFKGFYPNYLSNGYNDDIGWWALGCTRAYALTQNPAYLNDAKQMFDHIYNNWSEELGGGIYWNSERKEKNVCTNAPAAATAARLSVFLEDEGYLAKAIGLFNWVKDSLYDEDTHRLGDTVRQDGTVWYGQFSYNYGTFARAAYELYLATGEEDYLNYVFHPLDYLLETKTTDGILNSEGDGDGSAFRTIYLRTLNMVKHLKGEYQETINRNALAVYHNRRATDKLNGHDWHNPPAEDEIIISTLVGTGVSLMQFYKA